MFPPVISVCQVESLFFFYFLFAATELPPLYMTISNGTFLLLIILENSFKEAVVSSVNIISTSTALEEKHINTHN